VNPAWTEAEAEAVERALLEVLDEDDALTAAAVIHDHCVPRRWAEQPRVASDEEKDKITPGMVERAARALSDQTRGGHGNHWCAEWQKPDTPGVCGLCWDHAEAVLRAALTGTAVGEKEL
jgi:hypothetical protein